MATLLSLFFQWQCLFALLFFLVCVCLFLFPLKFSDQLRIHYGALLLSLLLPWLIFLKPAHSRLNAVADIWSAPSMKGQSSETLPTSNPSVSLRVAPNHTLSSSDPGFPLLSLVVGLLFLFFLFRCLRDRIRLRQTENRGTLFRQIGRVRLYVDSNLTIPFSFSSWTHAIVVIPQSLLTREEMLRVSILHELQHHRQGDTRVVSLLELFRPLLFANPFFYVWVNRLTQIQELACDETLVDQKKVSPLAYGRCLLEVAQSALTPVRPLAGTTSMAAGESGNILKRRIQMLVEKNNTKNTSAKWVVFALITILSTTACLATGTIVQDRRINLPQAKALARQLERRTQFPITINENVVKWLNQFVSTPDGQSYFKGSIARMRRYQSMIKKSLEKYRLPEQLFAIPLIESGFRNLPENPGPNHSAGLWQFIPSTARRYNLRVDSTLDERLDPQLATDAALRYLGALHFRFQDWELAMLSYNAGEGRVQRGINHTKSRNAWDVIEAGFDGDKDYLAKATAAVLILGQPSLLE